MMNTIHRKAAVRLLAQEQNLGPEGCVAREPCKEVLKEEK